MLDSRDLAADQRPLAGHDEKNSLPCPNVENLTSRNCIAGERAATQFATGCFFLTAVRSADAQFRLD